METDVEMSLPVEPLFTTQTAVLILPCRSKEQLYNLLWKYKYQLSEAKYMRTEYGRKLRMLTASDIQVLRKIIVKPGYFTGKRSKKGKHNCLESNAN